MAYEISKEEYDRNDQIWNFFYHCRNAAAHGGNFNITNKKRFPAKWGELSIVKSMNGINLFKTPSNQGLLGPGDPVYLLYEIETKYMI